MDRFCFLLILLIDGEHTHTLAAAPRKVLPHGPRNVVALQRPRGFPPGCPLQSKRASGSSVSDPQATKWNIYSALALALALAGGAVTSISSSTAKLLVATPASEGFEGGESVRASERGVAIKNWNKPPACAPAPQFAKNALPPPPPPLRCAQ